MSRTTTLAEVLFWMLGLLCVVFLAIEVYDGLTIHVWDTRTMFNNFVVIVALSIGRDCGKERYA